MHFDIREILVGWITFDRHYMVVTKIFNEWIG